jgi:hypothetical protein
MFVWRSLQPHDHAPSTGHSLARETKGEEYVVQMITRSVSRSPQPHDTALSLMKLAGLYKRVEEKEAEMGIDFGVAFAS